jgi:MerR family transcriptional regulator, light-induced transcriptional regulator
MLKKELFQIAKPLVRVYSPSEVRAQPPRIAHFDDTPVYNTRAAVRLTQVEAPRLRAWERRYAILSPHRSSNSYRLYSERDIAVIRWLREQVDAGMTISQATALLRNYIDSDAQAGADAASDTAINLDAIADAMITAARLLDEGAVVGLLQEAFAVYPVEEVCEQLIIPTMIKMGETWEQEKDVVVAEHFLSNIVRAQLDALWHLTYQPRDGPLAVVACVPGELHELGPFMLALFLRRRGVRVAFLGQNVEEASLLRCVAELRPQVVCLSVTIPENEAHAIELARQILRQTQVHVYLGGRATRMDGKVENEPRLTVLDAAGTDAADIIKRTLTAV